MITKFLKFCQAFCQAVVSDEPSKVRKSFGLICVTAILLDILVFPFETLQASQPYKQGFMIFNTIIVSFFTVEYVIRLIGHKNKRKFVLSFYGLIDLLAILPFILSFGGIHTSSVKTIRLLRIMRILKLARYTKAIDNLKKSIKNIKEELIVCCVFSFFIMYIFSAILFAIENGQQGSNVNSMFDALWLSLITTTTIGYGDIVPVTALGKILSTLFIVVSLGILAAPSALLASALFKGVGGEGEEEIHELERKPIKIQTDKAS